MKKLYLNLLSVLVGMVLWLGFAKGDIIDSTIIASEGDEAWHVIETTTEPENGDTFYGRLRKNTVISFFSQDIWFNIVHLLGKIAIFLICVFLLMTISVFSLYNIFEKLGEKWGKLLIPIRNLYFLADLVKTKKIGVTWWFFAIFSSLLIMIWDYFTLTTCLQMFDIHGRYRGVNSSFTCWLHNICNVISLFPIIIIFLVCDSLILISFYRLFRKFGWNKWYAVLWTIFFPIWACVLWFGNFECQWENLGEKEWNN